MKSDIVYLLSYSRKAYDNDCIIIKYDLNKKNIIETELSQFSDLKKLEFSGYFYKFYDWKRVIKELILYYKDGSLHLVFNGQEIPIKEVDVTKLFFWKKILINNELQIKIYSPFKTLFLITDQFPDAVEPIYDKFKDLSESNGIIDQINYFKNNLNKKHD